MQGLTLANNVAPKALPAVLNRGTAFLLDCRFRSLISQDDCFAGAIQNNGVLYVRPTGDPAGDFVDCGTEQNPPVLSSEKARVYLISLEKRGKQLLR
ncbi:MAG: hypothetical protein LBB04_00980 [Oscillospiraceae bacterium]|jgi:hypothetical protein|nr:hypothetical protein [Oscillospiraceae bacterium]